jgi:hypothetical protein
MKQELRLMQRVTCWDIAERAKRDNVARNASLALIVEKADEIYSARRNPREAPYTALGRTRVTTPPMTGQI